MVQESRQSFGSSSVCTNISRSMSLRAHCGVWVRVDIYFYGSAIYVMNALALAGRLPSRNRCIELSSE